MIITLGEAESPNLSVKKTGSSRPMQGVYQIDLGRQEVRYWDKNWHSVVYTGPFLLWDIDNKCFWFPKKEDLEEDDATARAADKLRDALRSSGVPEWVVPSVSMSSYWQDAADFAGAVKYNVRQAPSPPPLRGEVTRQRMSTFFGDGVSGICGQDPTTLQWREFYGL